MLVQIALRSVAEQMRRSRQHCIDCDGIGQRNLADGRSIERRFDL